MKPRITNNKGVQGLQKPFDEYLPIDVVVHQLLPHFKTKKNFLSFRQAGKFTNQCVDKFFSLERKWQESKKITADAMYLKKLNTALNDYIFHILEKFIYALDSNPLLASKMIAEMRELLPTPQIIANQKSPVFFEDRSTLALQVVAVLCQNNFQHFNMTHLSNFFFKQLDFSFPDVSPRFIVDYKLACMLLALANSQFFKTKDYLQIFMIAENCLDKRLVPHFINLQNIVLNGKITNGNLVEIQNTSNLFEDKCLANIDFSFAHLSNYKFSNANLTNCLFNNAVLKSLRFTDTNMRYAHLINTSLYDVSLQSVDFSNANLCGMRVYGQSVIDWQSCTLHNTQFIDEAQCTAETIIAAFHDLAENLKMTNLSYKNLAALEIALAQNVISIVNNTADRDKAIEILTKVLGDETIKFFKETKPTVDTPRTANCSLFNRNAHGARSLLTDCLAQLQNSMQLGK